MPRAATHSYTDPLDRIWVSAARAIGLRVERAQDTYASTTGNGVLLLAERAHLDPDDCLAQMILHELCHSLVEGETAFGRRDWGLDNETARDATREHACLRLQAALAGAYGLRRVLAPTTDFRDFYDALPPDPFSPRHDPTTTLAILARRRVDQPPWSPHLFHALAATQSIAESAASFDGVRDGEPDLLDLVETAPPRHPSGLLGSASVNGTCGTCAWRGRAGRCRQSGTRVPEDAAGCERYEPALDCRECGACCRAAYDCVQVSPRDVIRKKHPALVVVRGPYLEVARNADRCAALEGGGVDASGAFVSFACSIYEDRPKNCREFENAGEHCLTARRRVGLSL